MIGRYPLRALARIAFLIPICLIVFHFFLLPVRVTGISMLPTYKDHSVNLVNRLAYSRHEPRRGDVVTVRLAGLHMMLLKRIIGLPGETVAFQDGTVIINRVPLDEPYETWQCNWTLPPEKLGLDEYFVVGDNRTMPPQEHEFGIVKRERIVGKILF